MYPAALRSEGKQLQHALPIVRRQLVEAGPRVGIGNARLQHRLQSDTHLTKKMTNREKRMSDTHLTKKMTKKREAN